jgi:hypothetical protein
MTVHQVWQPSPADLQRWGRPMWWSVSPSQELAVLFVPPRHLRGPSTVAGWLGRTPELPFGGVLVTRGADGSVRHRGIPSVPVRPSHIAVMPGDRLLIVNGRAPKDAAGSWAANAVVLSPDGSVEDSFCVGDDIDVLVTAADGSIWTAYGDERHPRRPSAVHRRARRLGRPGSGPLDAGRTSAAIAVGRVQRRHRW